LLPAIWREGKLLTWLGYGLLVLVIFASFGLLLAGPIRLQRCAAMETCWEGSFPHWERPGTVPLWTTVALLEVFRYCFEPIGQVLAWLALAGTVSLWRRRLRTPLALLLVPLGLPLLAAYFQAYPFGGSRVVVYLTPALALLIAEGLPLPVAGDDSDEAGSSGWSRVWMLCRWGILVLALLPFTWAVRRAVEPWERADCAGAAVYVLTQYQPGDKVIANHWEYAYYFRHLGQGFSFLENAAPVLRGRLWLVTTAAQPADRLEILHYFGQQGWQVRRQHDLTRTSLFLLAP
jgi:hypothetical protein